MPAISLLTPVWNGLPYLREAIASVLSQNYSDWELIIADNGSTDGTRDYLGTLSDPRIRVVLHEQNLGIFGNLNFLLEAATAPVCKILCSDDFLLPGALEAHVDYFARHPEVGVIRCWAEGDAAVFGPGGYAEIQGGLPPVLGPAASALAFATFGNLLGNLTTASCRPEVAKAAGLFDQNFPYAGDFEGWIRLTRSAHFAILARELVHVRQHPGQQSNLLNRKNELAGQIDRIFGQLLPLVPADVGKVLRWHWTYHFVAPRWDGSLRLIRRGHFRDALKIWDFSPDCYHGPGVSLALFPFWKLRSKLGGLTTKRLFQKIVALNR